MDGVESLIFRLILDVIVNGLFTNQNSGIIISRINDDSFLLSSKWELSRSSNVG
jgi:hypothetical protein